MTTLKKQQIKEISKLVKAKLEGEGSGHDWWHIVRVWNMAKTIVKTEKADQYIVELAALLHDIADWKLHNGDDTVGPRVAKEIMQKFGVEDRAVEHVCEIILTMAFKGAKVQSSMTTLEGKIVQDADRLDAIGAIGIARTFAYGGNKNRPMHDPNTKPKQHKSKQEYITSESPTINHFYEKLLLLKNLMNTKTAKRIAKSRHKVMERYLERFFLEWEGKA